MKHDCPMCKCDAVPPNYPVTCPFCGIKYGSGEVENHRPGSGGCMARQHANETAAKKPFDGATKP